MVPLLHAPMKSQELSLTTHTNTHAAVAASAFSDGADYTYRVNDDTEFRTAWASAFVTALAEVS
jgi:hypothetical protein